MKKFLLKLKSPDLTITYALATKKHPELESDIKEAIILLSELKIEQKEYEKLLAPVIDLKHRKVADLYLSRYFKFNETYGELFSAYVMTSNAHHKKKKERLDLLVNSLFCSFSEDNLKDVKKIEDLLAEKELSAPKILKRKIKIDAKKKLFTELLTKLQHELSEKGFDFRKEFPFLDSEMNKE